MNRSRTYKFTIKKYTTDDVNYLKDNINYEYLSFYKERQILYGCIRFYNQKREHIVAHLMRNAKIVPMKTTEYNNYKIKIREKTEYEEFSKVRSYYKAYYALKNRDCVTVRLQLSQLCFAQ